MKRSSEIILVAALLAASFVIPSLQADASAADRRTALVEALGLTAEQQVSLDSIRSQEKAALEALKADTSLSPEQKREKMHTLRASFAGQRRQVLTADQQAKLKEKRLERAGGKHEGRKGKRERKT